jgi:hypothetical protein
LTADPFYTAKDANKAELEAADDGYGPLGRVLALAYEQAARGKGRERHARGKPFLQQPIMEIARMVGLPYQTGQLMKKAQEATAMAARGEHAAAKAEILGIINYAAAAYLLIEENQQGEPK